MTYSRLSFRIACTTVLGLVYGFLLLPLVVVAIVSLSPSPVFELPGGSLSMRWYAKLFVLDSFWRSFLNSTMIALFAATLSLVACTAACFALARFRPSWARSVIAFYTAPLLFPGLVIGIALMQFFAAVGMHNAMIALLLGHTVITIPFFVRSVLPAFANYDFDIYSAALCLGASPFVAMRRAVLPVVAPGIVGGYLFAFFASFENYTTSLFLTNARFKTVPIQILEYIGDTADPSLAAISTFLVGKTLILLLAVDYVFGIRDA